MSSAEKIDVAIIMGSKSDWDTMRPASEILGELGIAHECRVLSAHRTPTQLTDYIEEAEGRGCAVFIGGAGGAAHLPGVIAAQTLRPVLGVPVESVLQGMDSLLSILQMPSGIPVGAMAVGRAGATNAGLMAASILALSHQDLGAKIKAYRAKRADKVMAETGPFKSSTAGFKP